MRTAFSLEAFNDHIAEHYKNEPRSWPSWKEKPDKPYVAQLHGLSKRYGYDRNFVEPKKDYTKANRIGSRGVFMHWALEDGVYEVQEVFPKKKPARYFIRVADGGWCKIEETEVKECLLENAAWELVYLLRRKKGSPGPLIHSLGSFLVSLAAKTPASCCTS